MKTAAKSCSMLKVSLGIAATVLLIQNNPAAAQEYDEAIEEIVVKTPAIATRHEWTEKGRIEVWELRRTVSYSDLDLTLHKDVAELKGRIEFAAQSVCQELADSNPKFRKSKRTCVRGAVDGATEKMDMILAAAN